MYNPLKPDNPIKPDKPDKLVTELKLKWWPSLQDYNEAVQIPFGTLNDAQLKSGLVYTSSIGLPRPITGSFASVYRMNCGNTDFALRLFLRNISDQEDRYSLISEFVQNDDLPYTVTFDFLKLGIKIHDDWMPALKMQWVEGVPFDDYIVENLANPDKLGRLLQEFVKMMQELRRAGIAHGDLQHGNIIMCGNELRLVDYDGMYVPKMKGYTANELGHRNYQHPKRCERHFGPYLDNFSAWVIYASLKALQVDSRLFHQLGGGDDCLLFRQQDFEDPINSAAFAALEKHADTDLQILGRFIRAQLEHDPSEVPYLELPVPHVEHTHLMPLVNEASAVRSGPRLVRGTLPEWLEQSNISALFDDSSPANKTAPATPAAAAGTVAGRVSASGTASAKTTASSSSSISLASLLQAAPPPPSSATSSTTASPSSQTSSWIVQANAVQAAAWVKPTPPPPTQTSTAVPDFFKNATNGPVLSTPANTSQLSRAVNKVLQAANQSPLVPLPNTFLAAANYAAAASPTSFPPELTTKTPRIVKYNKKSGRANPLALQWMMVLNPIVWFMLSTGFAAITVDEDLTRNGLEVPATVTSINPFYGKYAHVDVNLEYKVKDQDYKTEFSTAPEYDRFAVGQQCQIRVAPSDPSAVEPYGSRAGTLQRKHLGEFFMWLVLVVLCQACIWLRPLKHWDLAKFGLPVLARVEDLTIQKGYKGSKGPFVHKVKVSYQVGGKRYWQSISLSPLDFLTLKRGDTEIILCNREAPSNFVFYKFCQYHPVDPARTKLWF